MFWATIAIFLAFDEAPVADFQFKDFRGSPHSLADFQDRKAVVIAFLGVECPLAKQYAGRLAELARNYESRGVAFLGLDPNEQDGLLAIGQAAKAARIDFPIGKDVGNALADRFGVDRVPEVFVLDGKRRIVYRGRIDDQFGFGYQRPKPNATHLKDALDAVLAGKSVAVSRTEPVGCRIGRVRPSDHSAGVTFAKDVAPIFNKRCVECHRPGQIGPMSLANAADVRGWAEMILEVVDSGRMPPWYANAERGAFKNDPRLTQGEKETIRHWANAGAPAGDPKDLPSPPTFAEGWRIPKPDVVLSMTKPFQVPANGDVQYQYFEIPTNFTEDKWISAAEARPGNRSVVHHIIVFVKAPDGRNNTATPGTENEWLTATAPGAVPMRLEPGHAKFVPRGSTLIFQIHYTPNGSPQTDRTSVGLVFADPKSVRREVLTAMSRNMDFVLKPGLSGQIVESSSRLAEDVILYSYFPHMHLRGQSFRYEAVFPNGTRETLLDIPRYDFAWQISYELPTPRLLPAGTTIRCVAQFDNSEGNLSNPDPRATVRWGDQTYEEMMAGYFDVVIADQDLTKSRVAQFNELAAGGKAVLTADMKDLARQALKDTGKLDVLATALKPVLPQLDRIDVLKRDGAALAFVDQTARGSTRLLAEWKSIPAKNDKPPFGNNGGSSDLLSIFETKRTVVRLRLSEGKGWDSQFLAHSFGSAVHLPWNAADGSRRLLSFYSREPNAFPPAAVKILENVLESVQPSFK